MLAAILLYAAVLPQPATVLDRIAVIVGKRAIKTSDIERDLRLTEFLNREPLDLSSAAKKKSAERLIDQQIIRESIATGGYPRATDAEAEKLLDQIRRDRFGSSDPALRAALSRYGVSEQDLREQLLWQLTVIRFINERFRPAVMVSDEDVRKYYDQHVAELRRAHPQNYSFEALKEQIRNTLEGEQTNQQFETWLSDARKRTHIEYRKEALE